MSKRYLLARTTQLTNPLHEKQRYSACLFGCVCCDNYSHFWYANNAALLIFWITLTFCIRDLVKIEILETTG